MILEKSYYFSVYPFSMIYKFLILVVWVRYFLREREREFVRAYVIKVFTC